MVNWFWRRSRKNVAPTLTSRSEYQENTGRIDISDMSPDVVAFLGQAAYFELAVFESLSRAVMLAPDLESKEGLTNAAAEVLEKHHALIEELRKLKVDPAVAMEPFAPAIDRFEQLTLGRDWYEMILGVYLTAGFLDDFFAQLVGGLPKPVAARMRTVLVSDRSADVIVTALNKGMEDDPTLSSRLALWGRRLIGDTQLVARSAVHGSGDQNDDEQRLEPVFTDLLATHSRRMDSLGLTA